MEAVRRAFANSILSLLLLTTVLWGGCVSCEQYFMFGGTKSCCTPHGKCKTTNTSARQDSAAECKQIAFDYLKSFDLHIDLPVAALAPVLSPDLEAATTASHTTNPADPSPPDLQVLHSTFLI